MKELNEKGDQLLQVNQREEFYCDDCKCHRLQKFKGIRSDKTLFYICEVCGCENTLEENTTED